MSENRSHDILRANSTANLTAGSYQILRIDVESLPSALKRSVLAHLALALAFIALLSFGPKSQTLPPVLRVDMIGLPDHLRKDLNSAKPGNPNGLPEKLNEKLQEAERRAKEVKITPPEVQKIPEPESKSKADVSPKAKPEKLADGNVKKMSSALDRIKSLQKIEASIDTDAKTEKLQARLKRLQQGARGEGGQIIKGNQLSAGNSLSSDAVTSNEANYADTIRERLHSNWVIPVWLSRLSISAQVRIRIDSNGALLSYRFEKTSGNTAFDDAVIQTIKRSAPFSPPPSEVADTMLNPGILAGFPL